jgi:hypothetical protein
VIGSTGAAVPLLLAFVQPESTTAKARVEANRVIAIPA